MTVDSGFPLRTPQATLSSTVRESGRGQTRDRRSLPVGLLFMLFCFTIPIQASVEVAGILLTPLRLGLILLLLPTLHALIIKKHGQMYSFDKLFMLYVVWVTFCLVLNRGPSEIPFAGQFFLENAVVYWVVRTSIRSVQDVRRLFGIMFLLAMVLALLAIPEAITRQHFILNFFGRLVGAPPVYANPIDVRMGLQRASTIFNHPILFGVFCASLVPFVFEYSRGVFSRIFRVGILTLGTFLSLSSAPMLVFLVQIALITGERLTRAIKGRVALFAGSMTFLLVMLESFTGRGFMGTLMIFTLNPGTTYYRKLIWENGIDDVLRNPIFGFIVEEWTRPGWMGLSVDNHWLLMMMHAGITAVLILIIATVSLVRNLYSYDYTLLSDDMVQTRRAWTFLMIGLILCGATVAFFDKLQPYFAMIFALGAAITHIMLQGQAFRNVQTPGDARPQHRRMVL